MKNGLLNHQACSLHYLACELSSSHGHGKLCSIHIWLALLSHCRWFVTTLLLGDTMQASIGGLHAGSKAQDSKHGLLTTVAFQLGPQEEPQYALEGSIAIAGAGISWLRDQLGLIQSAEESEALAASVPNTAGAICTVVLTYIVQIVLASLYCADGGLQLCVLYMLSFSNGQRLPRDSILTQFLP